MMQRMTTVLGRSTAPMTTGPATSRRCSLLVTASELRNHFSSSITKGFVSNTVFGTRGGGHTLGPPGIDGERNTPELMSEIPASGDFVLERHIGHLPPERTAETRNGYNEAYDLIQRGKWGAPERATRATQALGFSSQDRGMLIGNNKRYVNFSREIIRTTLDRQGTHHFNTGYFCMHAHFKDMLGAMLRTGKTAAEFVEHATLGEIGNGQVTNAEFVDNAHGQPAKWFEQERQLRGPDGKAAYQVLSAQGKPVDMEQYQQLYRKVSDVVYSPESIQHFSDSKGEFSQDALRAVQDLQKFLHGTHKVLPTDTERWADQELGYKPAQWKES
ncbi:MAG: hypothetical protein AB7P37_11805 [Ramlibacter sp.]